MALEDEPETVKLAGRQILVEQAPHILADIRTARAILESLLRTSPDISVPSISKIEKSVKQLDGE